MTVPHPSTPPQPQPGYVQLTPGAAPVPAGPAAPPRSVRSGGMGAIALVLALVALVGATLLSAITAVTAAADAMRRAVEVSPEGLENLTDAQLLGLLTPVRDLVLWAEIGFWAGTVLGLAALTLGIVAIVTRRGRGRGIAAVCVAAAAPIVYSTVVGLAIVAAIAVGAA